MICGGMMRLFKILTTKTRLREAERKNGELRERVEELTDALIEIAEIIETEEGDQNG